MENTSLTGDQKVANSSNSTVATQEQHFFWQLSIHPIQLLPHNNNNVRRLPITPIQSLSNSQLATVATQQLQICNL